MSESSPRALFLDLDGTLADSLPAMRAVYERFLAEQGRTGEAGEFERLNGPSLPEIVQALRDRHGLETSAAALEERYRALIRQSYAIAVRPNPGAHRLIAAAAHRRIPVVVVTSADRTVAEGFLEASRLRDSIARVVTADGLPRSKPDPAIYVRALALMKLAPGEVWAVEDSANGLRAATAAGLRTFALVPPGAAEPAVDAIHARIGSLAELAALLEATTGATTP